MTVAATASVVSGSPQAAVDELDLAVLSAPAPHGSAALVTTAVEESAVPEPHAPELASTVEPSSFAFGLFAA